MPNWLERATARAPTTTQPGLSGRDLGTRGRDFFWRPGDGWLRNTGRLVRAAAIGAATGPAGLAAAAARSAAQGEAREGLGYLARRTYDRMTQGRQEAPPAPRRATSAPESDPPPGYLMPLDAGPPEEPEYTYEGHGAPSPRGNRPQLNQFTVMREAPGAAAFMAGMDTIVRPRRVEK